MTQRCPECGYEDYPSDLKRSDPQNKRYWKVIVPRATQCLSKGKDVSYSRSEAHHALKGAFLGIVPGPMGIPVPVSTTTLSVARFSAFMDEIEAHFANTFPEEWGEG